MEQDALPMIAAVVGPTASGKTDAAIALCRALGGEAVSIDSMQVYRGMDIGTAKPTPAERGGVPHHLLSVAEPGAPFSVSDYRLLADEAIAEILSRGKLPVLVGGTGLYLNALTMDMDFAQTAANGDIRERLRREALAEGGKERLHARLAAVDPQSARRLHENDVRRVARALEIYEATGRPMSAHATEYRSAPRKYRPVIVGLTMPREVLYGRVDARVRRMLADGWLEEARALLRAGIPPDSQAMLAIGYRELARAARGEISLAEAEPLIQRATRRYAKRQLTWFRRDERVRWFDWALYPSAEALHLDMIEHVRRRLAERICMIRDPDV